jgi:Predicted metal binding domain
MPATPGFLCLPGTRAYHEHPAHSGDPWELHRKTGEGRLFALLETVWRYGAAPMDQLKINIGLGQSEFPA